MKVGDLVMYKGSPNILGMIVGTHDAEILIPFRKLITLWHVYWVGKDCEGIDPVTHEEGWVLEVADGA
jgi:hypothetical protein